AFLTEHIAGNPHNEKFVAALAEHHFCWNPSVGAPQDGSKGGLHGRATVPNPPGKSPRIKWDNTFCFEFMTGICHFREFTIALNQEPAGLFRSLGRLVRCGRCRIETIDELEHGIWS